MFTFLYEYDVAVMGTPQAAVRMPRPSAVAVRKLTSLIRFTEIRRAVVMPVRCEIAQIDKVCLQTPISNIGALLAWSMDVR